MHWSDGDYLTRATERRDHLQYQLEAGQQHLHIFLQVQQSCMSVAMRQQIRLSIQERVNIVMVRYSAHTLTIQCVSLASILIAKQTIAKTGAKHAFLNVQRHGRQI